MIDLLNVSMMVIIAFLWAVNVYQIFVGVPGRLKWVNVLFLPVVFAMILHNQGWLV